MRFPNYTFEWSIGESAIISTNLSSNLLVTHGLLQGYLLNVPQVPSNGFWYPDEIKLLASSMYMYPLVESAYAVENINLFVPSAKAQPVVVKPVTSGV